LKKTFVFLLLVFFLGGCGGEREAEQVSSSGKEEEVNVDTVEEDVLAKIIEVSPLSFQYQVSNQSEKDITLDFTSSQRFDYSIKTTRGEEIFLFSSVSSFLQVVGKEVLSPKEYLVYDIDVKEVGLSKGMYKLTVWMTPATGKAFSASLDFSVE
jgi:hypothetical protein